MASTANNITCPKCEIHLRPPFTTCGGGHLLCRNCQQHIDAVSGESMPSAECGDDQFPMSLLNNLLRNVSDECQYGCGLRTNIVDLSDHEEDCLWRAKCFINSCCWVGRLSKLIKHVKDDHPGRLVDTSVVQNHFTLGFEHSVLLLTQWEKGSPNNDLYWLRLHKNENSQFVIMQYQGQIGQRIGKMFLIKEYLISPVNCPKLFIMAEVLFTDSVKENIVNDTFVESKGTDVTICNADKFMIKLKDESLLSRKTLEENLECFICTEIMAGQIRMCVTGHSLCETCVGKINDKCPKCQKEINPMARNYALEALTENLFPNKANASTSDKNVAAVSCNYKGSGCQFTSTEGVEDHEKECGYQPWCCEQEIGRTICQWEGPFNKMFEHIRNRHRVIYCNVNEPHWFHLNVQHYFIYDNNYFIFKVREVQLRNMTKCYKLFFNHLTMKSECNYNFKIKMFDEGTEMTNSFSGYCTPIGRRHIAEFDENCFLKDFLNEYICMTVTISPRSA